MRRPHRPARHRLLVVVLAALLALQGMAAGVIVALGPLHVHASARVLDDFRRAPSAFGFAHATSEPHAHEGDMAARHHHVDALGVVLLDGGMPELGDDPVPSPALAAFVALIGDAAGLGAMSMTEARAAHTPWPCLTHVDEPGKRPPRTG